MTKPIRLGTALTAIGLVTALTACSSAGNSGAFSASRAGKSLENIGLASRAQVALASNDVATAVDLAERAVEGKPQEASFRALLGNAYLAAGRFQSAEAAYRDSLSLAANQPQVALKLALVQIAQNRSAKAIEHLYSVQSMLDPSDLGLALAMAGRPDQAVQVLEPAARAIGADGRVRQNLALAHAMAGHWDDARAIAAQDVPADQLETRLQQWIAMAKPGKASEQIASFMGVTPSAVDPGQPARLALNPQTSNARFAQAVPVAPIAPAAPVEAYQAQPEIAQVAEAPAYVAPEMPAVAEAEAPVAEPAYVAAAATVAAPAAIRAVAPAVAQVAPVITQVEAVTAKPKARPVKLASARPALTPAAVRLAPSLVEMKRSAAMTTGRSKAVVQLGAYSSRDRIALAWNRVTSKYSSLRGYTPVTARFEGSQGTVYRLSVKGFSNDREALQLCGSIKRSGGNCFVRAGSGDAPVQFASR